MGTNYPRNLDIGLGRNFPVQEMFPKVIVIAVKIWD